MHRRVILWTRARSTLQRFEVCALEEVTCHQLWELSSRAMPVPGSLVEPRGANRAEAEYFAHLFPQSGPSEVALSGRGNNGRVSAGDVVVAKVGQVNCKFNIVDTAERGRSFMNKLL